MARQNLGMAIFSAIVVVATTGADSGKAPQFRTFANPTGQSESYSTGGAMDLSNPFFQGIGINGRSCSSCHQPADGWTIKPSTIQASFDKTAGTDPIFRLNDGANSPLADISTLEKRRAAFSMLLTKGLIRVGIGIPPNAEFELADVDDPYGFASASELSLFRRPLPSANLPFLNTVMWDGRETFSDDTSSDCIRGTTRCFANIHFNLADQSNAATQGHAQAPSPLTQEQRKAIVDFELGLFTAQAFDANAKSLDSLGAHGGAKELASQVNYFGINDVLEGDYKTGAPFDPNVFHLFDAWAQATGGDKATSAARRSIARGQALFNTKKIHITGVKGINDDLGVAELDGTCTTCHDAPGVGNHSVPMPLDIGLADASRATPDQPMYVLRNKATGDTVHTTDPGRALITGKWKDIGRFKGPALRSLASRAPYFHNGSAANLGEVVDFYNQRFSIGFTPQEKADIVAFLQAL